MTLDDRAIVQDLHLLLQRMRAVESANARTPVGRVYAGMICDLEEFRLLLLRRLHEVDVAGDRNSVGGKAS